MEEIKRFFDKNRIENRLKTEFAAHTNLFYCVVKI